MHFLHIFIYFKNVRQMNYYNNEKISRLEVSQEKISLFLLANVLLNSNLVNFINFS